MTTDRTTLLPDELRSLQVLAEETNQKRVSLGHGKTLVRCGFAAGQAGRRLAITMTGRAKLVIEVTRTIWIPVLI
jgi:hypothetical protein